MLYQLEFSNGKIFNRIFSTNSKKSIKDYILLNFSHFIDDLDLSEGYSCIVSLSLCEEYIIISGDEDYCEISIKEVNLIEL